MPYHSRWGWANSSSAIWVIYEEAVPVNPLPPALTMQPRPAAALRPSRPECSNSLHSIVTQSHAGASIRRDPEAIPSYISYINFVAFFAYSCYA